MPPILKQKPVTSLEASHFAGQVSALHAGMEYGDDPIKAIERTYKGWMRIDPIGLAQEPAESLPPVYAAMGKATEIAAEASRDKRARRLSFPIGHIGLQLGIDHADIGLRTPGTDITEVRTGLQAIADSTAKGEQVRGVQETSQAFANLSANAMLLHAQAAELSKRRLPEHFRRSSEAVLGAMLGGLVHDSAKYIHEAYTKWTQLKPGSGAAGQAGGHMVEAMYLGYRLMDWHKSGDLLTSGYSRFALEREDMPHNGHTKPKRGFDVISRLTDADAEPELIQVKAGTSARYAEDITLWMPQKNPIENAPTIVGWFDRLANNRGSDARQEADWRQLSAYFEAGHRTGPRADA